MVAGGGAGQPTAADGRPLRSVVHGDISIISFSSSGAFSPGPHFKEEWITWPTVRAHLVTAAITLSLNLTWWIPREAFRLQGLFYGVIVTAAMITVALPVSLLQLAVGQLSQQDCVGIWNAVPFFKGIGYIRIIIAAVGSAYTAVYLGLISSSLFYTATHSMPFAVCIETIIIENDEYYEVAVNASECLDKTFMSPVTEAPEYFLAVGLITTALWILSSCVFYSPVKFMKRIFYIVPPFILVLAIVVLSLIGHGDHLSTFADFEDWSILTSPYIWQSAVVQALWSTQISGGFLISAGDSIYSSTNVKWTSTIVVTSSIISCWFWLVFWFCIRSELTYTSPVAVLLQSYQIALENEERKVWLILLLIILILSGVISLLAVLYPVFDRLRRMGGLRWRVTAFVVTIMGAGVSVALLGGRLPLLVLVQDFAVSLLVCLATALEVLVFGFIYGWRNLIEDVEFLTGSELSKYWVWGWWLAAIVILPVIGWWTIDVMVQAGDWSSDPWQAVAVIAACCLAVAVLLTCACIAVGNQVQFDILGKLKSSFKPSRHWGPRDPITHYYWLARREEDRTHPRTSFNRRELGQFSTRPNYLTVSEQTDTKNFDTTKRSYSDDWLFTFGKKQHFKISFKKRSKSLDFELPCKKQVGLSLESFKCETQIKFQK